MIVNRRYFLYVLVGFGFEKVRLDLYRYELFIKCSFHQKTDLLVKFSHLVNKSPISPMVYNHNYHSKSSFFKVI
jgi:hypothetical protein